MDKPLVWIACGFTAGIVMEKFLNLNIQFYVISFVLLFVAAFFLLKRDRQAAALVLALAIAAGGMWLALARENEVSSLTPHAGDYIELEGVVLSAPEHRGVKIVWDLEADKFRTGARQWNDISGETVRIYFSAGEGSFENIGLNYGDRIRVAGRLGLPPERRNPGDFDYREYLKHRGVFTFLHVYGSDDVVLLERDQGSFVLSLANRGKKRFKEYILQQLPEREAGLLSAMLFGDKEGVSREDRELFSEIGVAHAFAVSGLHVGFVLLFFYAVARVLRMSPRGFLLLSVTGLIFYCALSGFAVSVVRAVIMGILGLLAFYFGREKDALIGLAAAALVILIWNPFTLFEPGFQLSFTAVLSMLYLLPLLEEWFSFLPPWGKLFTVPLAAQLGTAPVMAFHFSIFSPVALVANVLLIGLVGIIVINGLFIFVFYFAGKIIADLLLQTEDALLFLLLKAGSFLAAVQGSALYVPVPSIAFVVLYYLLLVGIKVVWIKRERLGDYFSNKGYLSLVVMGIAAVLIIVAGLNFNDQNMEVVFLDVGQGDAVFIETPSGRRVLVDGGGMPGYYKGSFRPGRDVVIPFLRRRGIGSIDFVINTHPDADHINGLYQVLQEVSVGCIITPPVGPWQDRYEKLLDLAAERGIPHREVSRGVKIDLGPAVGIAFLGPPGNGEFFDNPNAGSLVLRLIHGCNSFLLTGDLEGAGMDALLEAYPDLDCTVMKLPHHGSETSFDEEFYRRADPEAVVISVGENNSFGHPSSIVIRYWDELGVPVYRTDTHGAVVIESDSKKCYIHTIRQ